MRLLIYSSIWSTIFPPREQFKTESVDCSVHTRYVKILHTYTLISHPLFQNILFNTKVWPIKPQNFSTLYQGYLHNPVWPLTSTSNKISNPFVGEFTKTPAWPLTSASNSRPILRGIHKTLPISITFPTSNLSHGPNYGSKCTYMSILQRNIADFRILPGARIKIPCLLWGVLVVKWLKCWTA